jgi:hypothetical protein
MKRWQVVDLDEIYDIVIQIFFILKCFFFWQVVHPLVECYSYKIVKINK